MTFTWHGMRCLLRGNMEVQRGVDGQRFGMTWPRRSLYCGSFFLPILGPGSLDKAKAIWCAKDKDMAWRDWMREGKAPTVQPGCDTSALDRNLALGDARAIRATPTLACYTICDKDCQSSSGGGWWGCWRASDDGKWNLEPGKIIPDVNHENANDFAKINGQPHRPIQQWTYYSGQDLGGMQARLNKEQGKPGIGYDYKGAFQNRTLLKGYLDDYRFLVKKVGFEKNIIHLEPDTFGTSPTACRSSCASTASCVDCTSCAKACRAPSWRRATAWRCVWLSHQDEARAAMSDCKNFIQP